MTSYNPFGYSGGRTTINNGAQELGGLNDVVITNPAQSEVISYVTGSGHHTHYITIRIKCSTPTRDRGCICRHLPFPGAFDIPGSPIAECPPSGECTPRP